MKVLWLTFHSPNKINHVLELMVFTYKKFRLSSTKHSHY